MADLRFGILTASDTCFADPSKDRSGADLRKVIIEEFPNATLCFKEIIPDNKEMIQRILEDRTTVNSDCDVILVTGGTGFAPRDVTPEATRAVIQKEAPGLAYAMISKSLQLTDMAMLSRLVCGIRNHTLIVNLPGSPKGSVECFNFIKKCLPHAVALLRDNTKVVAKTHEGMQGGSTYGTTVSPSKVKCEVAFRKRESEYPMLEVEESVKIICDQSLLMEKVTEYVDITSALGRILAEDVVAKDDLPPFNASMKDGYAVITSDGSGRRIVKDAVPAGESVENTYLKNGEIIRISTGAAVPNGADAVVQVEDTQLVSCSKDGCQEFEVEIKKSPEHGQDIRPIGSDIKKGSIVMNTGDRISVGHIGVLATVGVAKIKVFKKPKIGILSTGNEVQSPYEELKPFHIRDSNKYSLIALLQQFNFEAADCGLAKDNADDVKEKLTVALSKNDIVITTGGVSMGEFDLIKKVVEVDFGGFIHFGRVNMKPGKPTTFATLKHNGKFKLLFGLPGNPVSAVVTSTLFVLPALRTIVNFSKTSLPVVRARLLDWRGVLDIRPEYLRVSLELSKEDNILRAKPTGNQISSRVNSFIGANGLLRLPGRNEPNAAQISPDTVFDVLLLDPFTGSI